MKDSKSESENKEETPIERRTPTTKHTQKVIRTISPIATSI